MLPYLNQPDFFRAMGKLTVVSVKTGSFFLEVPAELSLESVKKHHYSVGNTGLYSDSPGIDGAHKARRGN